MLSQAANERSAQVEVKPRSSYETPAEFIRGTLSAWLAQSKARRPAVEKSLKPLLAALRAGSLDAKVTADRRRRENVHNP